MEERARVLANGLIQIFKLRVADAHPNNFICFQPCQNMYSNFEKKKYQLSQIRAFDEQILKGIWEQIEYTLLL